MFQLTAEVCMDLCSKPPGDPFWETTPTLQVFSIKDIMSSRTGQSTERRRAVVSDGVYYIQVMLATQLNPLISDGSLNRNTVVMVKKMICNVVKDKRLVVLLEVEILGQPEEKIGEPRNAEEIHRQMHGAQAVTNTLSAQVAPQPAAPAQAPKTSAPTHNSAHPVYPIEGLSPYQNKWTIKARVTQKSEMKHWSNQRGDGKLFNVNLMDETGEIRATAFNRAADELYEKLQEGKVYYISRARVNVAKKKFSSLPNNEYEISLEANTEIEECTDTTNVPTVKYNFVQLAQLDDLAKDAVCDILAVVKEAADLDKIITKATGREVPKRELTIVDRSGFSVRLTLWGKQAEQWSQQQQQQQYPIIACKGVRVGDFGGRSLSLISSSIMSMNPDIEEAHLLRGWFDTQGETANFSSYSGGSSTGGGNIDRNQLRTIQSVKDDGLGQADRVDNFTCKATVVHIKSDNISYPACPANGCNKKVTQLQEGGDWFCEKCNKPYPAPEHRYIVSFAVADYSSQFWLQGFNDAGAAVFGRPANDLVELKNSDESEFLHIVRQAATKTYLFACRAKQDSYNDQTRVRYAISKVQNLDFAAECRAMLDNLSLYPK